MPKGKVISAERREALRKYHREWAKKWRRNHPELAKEQSKKAREWQLRNPVQHALNTYKTRARYRNIAFDLSQEEFSCLAYSSCRYCGKSPSPINGIDRVDNSKGYVRDNVVPACGQCNVAKNDYTVDEFREWIFRVALYFKSLQEKAG